MNICKTITGLFGMMGLALAVAPAQAQFVTLTAPGHLATVNTVAAPNIATLLATETSTIIGGVNPAGTVTSSVYQISGGLLFSYTLNNTTNPTLITNPGAFEQLGLGSFQGLTTQVAYVYGSGVAPSTTSDPNAGTLFAATRNTSGATITFNFNNPAIATGANTATLLIRTNAGGFSPKGSGTAVNGGTHSADIIDPLMLPNGNAVLAPEPASFAVFGFVGLGVLGLMVRARRGKTQLAA